MECFHSDLGLQSGLIKLGAAVSNLLYMFAPVSCYLRILKLFNEVVT